MKTPKKKKPKPRNIELAVVLKKDPARLKTRVKEGRKRKQKHSRSTRKEKESKEIKENL